LNSLEAVHLAILMLVSVPQNSQTKIIFQFWPPPPLPVQKRNVSVPLPIYLVEKKRLVRKLFHQKKSPSLMGCGDEAGNITSCLMGDAGCLILWMDRWGGGAAWLEDRI